jgi:hypothetical protein
MCTYGQAYHTFGISPDSPSFLVLSGVMSGFENFMTGKDFFLILDLYARHRVFKHSLTAMHLSADLGASADVDFDEGVATGLTTTFYLFTGQHNRGNVFMLFLCVK